MAARPPCLLRTYEMSPAAYRAAHPPAAQRALIPPCVLLGYDGVVALEGWASGAAELALQRFRDAFTAPAYIG